MNSPAPKNPYASTDEKLEPGSEKLEGNMDAPQAERGIGVPPMVADNSGIGVPADGGGTECGIGVSPMVRRGVPPLRDAGGTPASDHGQDAHATAPATSAGTRAADSKRSAAPHLIKQAAGERLIKGDGAAHWPGSLSEPAAGDSLIPPRRAHLVIKAESRWKFVDLYEVWEFRDLLFSLAGRDLKLRYKQTLLGIAWVVLQPLMATLIFTAIGLLAGMNKTESAPYPALTFAAMLGWNLFANIVSRSSTVMVSNANLVSKVYFPRVILPLASSVSVLVDFCCSCGVMALLLIYYHLNPFPYALLLPLFMLIPILFGLGVGMVCSALAVSYRDIQYILPVFMQMLMYASTVIFPLSWVRVKLEHFHLMWIYPYYCANPLIGILSTFRWALVSHGNLALGPVLWSATCAVAVFMAGLMLFKQMERRFADIV
jgi:lipopolysaccharide transport system permease protein